MNLDSFLAFLAFVMDAKIVYFFVHRCHAIESRDPDIVGDIRSLAVIERLESNAASLASPWKRECCSYLAWLLRSGGSWNGAGEYIMTKWGKSARG